MKKHKTRLLVNVPQTNDGYKSLISKIQVKLDAMDTETKSHYLKEVYETYLIYEISGQAASQLFKTDYTETDNGVIEFSGELTEVREDISFSTMEEQEMTEAEKSRFKMDMELGLIETVSEEIEKTVTEEPLPIPGFDKPNKELIAVPIKDKKITEEPAPVGEEPPLMVPVEKLPNVKETKPIKGED